MLYVTSISSKSRWAIGTSRLDQLNFVTGRITETILPSTVLIKVVSPSHFFLCGLWEHNKEEIVLQIKFDNKCKSPIFYYISNSLLTSISGKQKCRKKSWLGNKKNLTQVFPYMNVNIYSILMINLKAKIRYIIKLIQHLRHFLEIKIYNRSLYSFVQ